MNRQEQPIYGIDTSSLAHVPEVFAPQANILWTNLISLITAGRLKTVPFALSEFVGWETEYDKLKPYRKLFLVEDEPLVPLVAMLVRRYEGLLNGSRRANQADPWIVAMCLHYGYVPVTNERVEHRRGRMSIAWVCQQEGLTPITLEELVAGEGLL